MEISPILLFWLVVSSFLWGALAGVLHDFHRFLRMIAGNQYLQGEGRPSLVIGGTGFSRLLRRLLVTVQDIILFLFAGTGIVLLTYRFNRGQFRFLPVLALLFGFIIYYFTLGRIILWLSRWTAAAIRKVLVAICTFALTPFVRFVEFFGKTVKNLLIKLKKGIAKRRKKVYNERK